MLGGAPGLGMRLLVSHMQCFTELLQHQCIKITLPAVWLHDGTFCKGTKLDIPKSKHQQLYGFS